MDALALVRPDDWNLPLFVHVLGAMVLMGVLIVAAHAFVAARVGAPGAERLGYRWLLVAGLPAYLAMRIGAQWVADEEGLADSDAAWITIGYMVADAGALLLVIALVCTGIASRRRARGEVSRRLVNAGIALTGVLIAAYIVAVWAMTVKPA